MDSNKTALLMYNIINYSTALIWERHGKIFDSNPA